jgi:LPXTG-motif cell wall-anchored protein
VQLSIGRRGLGLAGLSAMAAAISVAAAVPAQASELSHSSGQCGRTAVAYSVNGGMSWPTSSRITGEAVTKIEVRLAGAAQQGCEYSISLASYSAQGPTWQTSGTQRFLGWVTTTLGQGHTTATLDVSAYAPSCFGQIDLYANARKFDGMQGPLPLYPASPVPTDLIAAWNGKTTCPGTAKPKPKPAVGAPASPTPTPSASGNRAVAGNSRAAGNSALSPAASDVSNPVPSGSPEPPAAQSPAASLAHTGSNGTQTAIMTAVGAALLALGTGAVYRTRRRKGTTSS